LPSLNRADGYRLEADVEPGIPWLLSLLVGDKVEVTMAAVDCRYRQRVDWVFELILRIVSPPTYERFVSAMPRNIMAGIRPFRKWSA
jgi:hypothetical protein